MPTKKMKTLFLILHSCVAAGFLNRPQDPTGAPILPAGSSYNFKPDNAPSFDTPNIPTLYDLTESQFESGLVSSHYAGSFLTTSDGSQYFVVSQILLVQPQSNLRHSVFDITDPSRYWANSEYAPTPDKTNLTRGPWNYTFMDFGFEATTEDAVSHMQTWVSAADYSFNISWDATSTALHNLGSGTFNFGGANNSQWSLPACRTQGTLTIGDTEFTIDPENSHTWYDRQWGYSKPPTFTWLGLRFPESDISLSVWAIDYASGTSDHEWRFATVRTSLADQILSLNFIPDANSTWTSPSSNNTYPTRWTLEFQNGDSIVVTSARPDQELGTGISAFVHVEGSFLGNQGGSGVVDVLL